MPATPTTPADSAKAAAFRQILQNTLLNGTTGSLVLAALTPGTSPSSLQVILDMLEMAWLSGVALAENPNPPSAGAFPPQVPSFTFATLPLASMYPGGLVLVSDRAPTTGANGLMAYSDGTNWRKIQDGVTVT